MSDSLQPHGLYSPCNFPGQNTGEGSHSLLQGIKLMSPALQADSLPAEPQRKPKNTGVGSLSLFQGIFPGIELESPALQVGSLLAELTEYLCLMLMVPHLVCTAPWRIKYVRIRLL